MSTLAQQAVTAYPAAKEPPFSPGKKPVPPLENGSHLSAKEFLRRYEAMPYLKKAELIDGEVYVMASPVRADKHGEPDALMHYWLGDYAFRNPMCKIAANTTVRLSPDDTPQPDALLRLLPEHGGKSKIGGEGYLEGPPELVVEIAASSASLDVRKKLAMYRRSGVAEYLVWRTEDAQLDWWTLEDDEYRPLPPDAHGIIRSRIFPSLCLDVTALLAGNMERVMDVLRREMERAAL